MFKMPAQQDLDDVPDCLRALADAIEATPAMGKVSVVVLVRQEPETKLHVLGFGKSENTSEQAFTECHIAAKQLLELMTK